MSQAESHPANTVLQRREIDLVHDEADLDTKIECRLPSAERRELLSA